LAAKGAGDDPEGVDGKVEITFEVWNVVAGLASRVFKTGS